MLTLAIVAVLAAVAIPNMGTFVRNNRLTAASNDLLRSMQLARSEAVKRQANVVVCASDDPAAAEPSCSYGEFTGWIVFQDTNANWTVDSDDSSTPDNEAETIIERHGTLNSAVRVVADQDGIVSYSSSGFATSTGSPSARSPTQNIILCDERGERAVGENSTARAVLIDPTGRARVTKLRTAVQTAISAAGASATCPS
jgi:type IV fimbrial biogenesis protein FimT